MVKEVCISVEEFANALELEILNTGKGEIHFSTGEISRPGMQLAGYYEHFVERRVQLIGNAEMHYLYSLQYDSALMCLERFMSYKLPCIVCSQGNQPPDAVLDCAERHMIPIFLSYLRTDDVAGRMSSYISRQLAPRMRMHGELLDIFGVGVLLRGPSGIGKSETALELIKEGHRLVADDVVEITRVTPTRVTGCAPELTRYLMEIRGVGLVDVRYLYGVGAVIHEKSVDLIIDIELWNENTPYERIGSTERYAQLLGVDVPVLLIPISPGRSMKVVVEVAARNFILKRLGYDAASDYKLKTMKNLDLEGR